MYKQRQKTVRSCRLFLLFLFRSSLGFNCAGNNTHTATEHCHQLSFPRSLSFSRMVAYCFPLSAILSLPPLSLLFFPLRLA